LPKDKGTDHGNHLALSYYITARRQLEPGSDENGSIAALREKVRAAFAAGVDYVQIREKDLPGGRLARLVEEVATLPEKAACRLLVNERLDVALTCGADGVHLPSDSLPLEAVQSRAGANWLAGVSCHVEEDVERAASGGASYVLLGPVFATPSKPEGPPLGIARLREICRRSPVPLFALGGVTRENAGACVQAGAAGIAGIRLFQQAPDLSELCRYVRSLSQ
jgi:thiamine-phosphate pyrophosphorylase